MALILSEFGFGLANTGNREVLKFGPYTAREGLDS